MNTILNAALVLIYFVLMGINVIGFFVIIGYSLPGIGSPFSFAFAVAIVIAIINFIVIDKVINRYARSFRNYGFWIPKEVSDTGYE